MHINGQYTRKGEIDVKQLFKMEDISKDVFALKDDVENLIEQSLKIISMEEPPERCTNPKTCPILEECWPNLPEDNVFTLYRGGKTSVELFENGILAIKDIDKELNPKQEIQRLAVKSGKAHIDRKAIDKFLNSLEYPLYYLDFETIGTAIPLFDGTKPYQSVPFQYSLHIAEKDGKIIHKSFLSEGGDPRKAFIEALKKDLGKKGTIVAYNMSFEKTVLNGIAIAFGEYREWVDAVLPRFVDLLVPFRNFHYYHPKQNGSASIKKVLPAITGKGYSHLDISNGEQASLEYLRVTFLEPEAISKKELAKIRKDLEEYCALDTKGMVDIVGELGNITRLA